MTDTTKLKAAFAELIKPRPAKDIPWFWSGKNGKAIIEAALDHFELLDSPHILIRKVGGEWPRLLVLEFAARAHQTPEWVITLFDALSDSLAKEGEG